MFELWQWSGERWEIVGTYRTLADCKAKGRATADPIDTWTIAKVGSQKAEHMRANVSSRYAYSE